MAQKDKVKELVGRGLGSYHTKSLQQMDRIEKKNKEQSHKISILTNELDNDYLTKTEEGSVISLAYTSLTKRFSPLAASSFATSFLICSESIIFTS